MGDTALPGTESAHSRSVSGTPTRPSIGVSKASVVTPPSVMDAASKDCWPNSCSPQYSAIVTVPALAR